MNIEEQRLAISKAIGSIQKAAISMKSAMDIITEASKKLKESTEIMNGVNVVLGDKVGLTTMRVEPPKLDQANEHMNFYRFTLEDGSPVQVDTWIKRGQTIEDHADRLWDRIAGCDMTGLDFFTGLDHE